MKLFGQIVRTVVNAAMLPIEVVKDIYTLGGVVTSQTKTYTAKRLEKLMEDAEERT